MFVHTHGLYRHPTSIQTPNKYTDTQTSIQTPNKYTDPEIVYRHRNSKQTQKQSTNTELVYKKHSSYTTIMKQPVSAQFGMRFAQMPSGYDE